MPGRFKKIVIQHVCHQVQAGASTILTQPPFLWQSFERWYEDLERYYQFASLHVLIPPPVSSHTTSRSHLAIDLAHVDHLCSVRSSSLEIGPFTCKSENNDCLAGLSAMSQPLFLFFLFMLLGFSY